MKGKRKNSYCPCATAKALATRGRASFNRNVEEIKLGKIFNTYKRENKNKI